MQIVSKNFFLNLSMNSVHVIIEWFTYIDRRKERKWTLYGPQRNMFMFSIANIKILYLPSQRYILVYEVLLCFHLHTNSSNSPNTQ